MARNWRTAKGGIEGIKIGFRMMRTEAREHATRELYIDVVLILSRRGIEASKCEV
jgi:hypothetical protein